MQDEVRAIVGRRDDEKDAAWIVWEGMRARHGVVAGYDRETGEAIVSAVADQAAQAGWVVWFVGAMKQPFGKVAEVFNDAQLLDVMPRLLERANGELKADTPARVLVVLDDPVPIFGADQYGWSGRCLETFRTAGIAVLVMSEDLAAIKAVGRYDVQDSLIRGNVVHTRSANRRALDVAWAQVGMDPSALPVGGTSAYLADPVDGVVEFTV